MFRCTLFAVAVAFLTLAVGCSTDSGRSQLSASNENQTPTSDSVDPAIASSTPKPVESSIASLRAAELCERLAEIEIISDRVPEESDDLYKAIIAKGKEALPCLIDKINDRTKTRDPGTGPKWQHYVVGDTAVFTILDIVSQGDYELWKTLFLGPLPPAYKEEWKTNGIYAYYNFVSEPKNRKELQDWWRKWLKANKN